METDKQIFERLQREQMRKLARRSWKKLTPEERSERARNAVRARWEKQKSGARSQKLEVRSQKAEARSQKAEGNKKK